MLNRPWVEGATTTTTARPARPTSASIGLRSSESSRALAHHQPRRPRSTAISARRVAGASTTTTAAAASNEPTSATACSRETFASMSPAQSEPASRCAGACDHLTAAPTHEFLDPCGTDPRNRVELVDRREWPVGLAVSDDLLRRDRSDAGKRVQLLGRRGVQINRSRRARRPGAAPYSPTSRERLVAG